MPANKMKFLQIIKENISEVNNGAVVKVNYKALNKLLEEHDRLSKSHEDFTPEDESLESYGSEMMTVNHKSLSELVESYEKLLESIRNS